MYNFKELETNKLLHCNNVAKVMYYIAKDCLHSDEELCKEMASLGLVHDIGCMYATVLYKHPAEGAVSLPGYKYASEVAYHGNPDFSGYSMALRLLNFADLHVDAEGNIVPLEDRLEDIKNRYGDQSMSYRNASRLARMIFNKEWEDKVRELME